MVSPLDEHNLWLAVQLRRYNQRKHPERDHLSSLPCYTCDRENVRLCGKQDGHPGMHSWEEEDDAADAAVEVEEIYPKEDVE